MSWEVNLLNSCRYFCIVIALWTAGCAAPQHTASRARADSFPANALVTQRGRLTVRGRQFTLNGYAALSETGARRLIVTENFGSVLADVLVKPDGKIYVMRSSRVIPAAWVRRCLAEDLKGVFNSGPGTTGPVRMIDPGHFQIKRFWYQLDLRTVETKTGPQPAGSFEEKPAKIP